MKIPSLSFVNMMELLTTVIQVGGLTHHFLGKCLYQVGNMKELFSSFTFGHVLGLEILHVPIVFILGNVLGLDEWHLPICYQNPPFSWENACTKSGMCCFSVVPLIENSDG